MKKAFVCAARCATRIVPAFSGWREIPIEGGGKSLLEWHALRLSEAGLRQMTVITGHKREQIAAAPPVLAERHGIKRDGTALDGNRLSQGRGLCPQRSAAGITPLFKGYCSPGVEAGS
jgi:hypothetical protein